MKTIAFFNNKGGVGKTSLIYHVGWMLALRGARVLLADLDPQANLTNMCLDEEQLEHLWSLPIRPTIYSSVASLLLKGTGDIAAVAVQPLYQKLDLLAGDLSLANVEDELSLRWPACLEGKENAFRATTAFFRAIKAAGAERGADVALIDIGPNLGAINRTALIAADFIVVPLAPDLFSVQGMENMGPKLREWRKHWRLRRDAAPESLGFELPNGDMQPIGYVVSRHSVLAGGAVKAFQRWLDTVPDTYSRCILDRPLGDGVTPENDENKLAQLKDYRSLMPMAQAARRPMFRLRAADGAIGGHQSAVSDAHADFWKLTGRIADRAGISLRA